MRRSVNSKIGVSFFFFFSCTFVFTVVLWVSILWRVLHLLPEAITYDERLAHFHLPETEQAKPKFSTISLCPTRQGIQLPNPFLKTLSNVAP